MCFFCYLVIELTTFTLKMLTRRIPALTSPSSPSMPTKNPIPAIPPHMQRNPSVGGIPQRPRSPQLPNRSQTPPNPTRPQSPGPVPHRPGSPFRSRTVVQPSVTSIPISQPTDVEVDLTINDFIHDSVFIEKPFEISCTLSVTAPVPPGRSRSILLAVQHILPARGASAVHSSHTGYPMRQPTLPTSSGTSSPSPSYRGTFAISESLTERLLVASPKMMNVDEADEDILMRDDSMKMLPPPFVSPEDEMKRSNKTGGVAFLGASAIFLDTIHLKGLEVGDIESREFSLTYMPMRKGFSTVGGLRILLVGDQLDNEEQHKGTAIILKEWGVIAEVWVQG
jgi:trafficking protein particle complex subunit 13